MKERYDFAWAIKTMKAGYPVRHTTWSNDKRLYYSEISQEYMLITEGISTVEYEISDLDFNDTVWEKYAGDAK